VLVLGLLVGIAFGAILSLSGLSDPARIIEMLRLRDLRLFKLLVAAIGVGIAGIAVLDAAGLAHTSVKTLHVLAILSGGAIFGAGFALAGYCPGTSLAAAAEGRRDALFTVAGGLAGAGAHAALYAWLLPRLVEPLTFGKPTLHSLLGWPAPALGLPSGGAMLWIAYRWWRAERVAASARDGGRGGPRSGALADATGPEHGGAGSSYSR
jgi:uncharacterized membrane protein YedE/YeeE